MILTSNMVKKKKKAEGMKGRRYQKKEEKRAILLQYSNVKKKAKRDLIKEGEWKTEKANEYLIER